MDNSRRKALLTIFSSLSLPLMHKVYAASSTVTSSTSPNNFKYIYNNSSYRKEFLTFLTNVFHLYPENEIHSAIHQQTQTNSSDEEIYKNLQNNLSDIKPLLADLTYALPALIKQKRVIATQTSELLGPNKHFEGYLEFGSNGRYLDSLEEKFEISGNIHFINEVESTFSPVDMIDRGQVCKYGEDILLNNYRSQLPKHISAGSIDLATVYIGFHHCPIELREEFITSIRNTMSDDGFLILRDHNVENKKMSHMVGLAHDVFNMGTKETWSYNQDELRHFYSLEELDKMLNSFGFKSDGRKLYQKGDPTLNALMLYKKS